MNIRNLESRDIQQIHVIYEQFFGVAGTKFGTRMLDSPENILRYLQDIGQGNYVIGSKWNNLSSLVVRQNEDGDVTFSFRSNLSPTREREAYEQAEIAQEKFNEEIKNYFKRKYQESKR